MNRLRVRVELNRRKRGVPLTELIGVVEETRKFFHLLAEDVEIETDRGEWLASDFDPESLNFTVEYDGPATAKQISEFGAAFSGTTSLRQETIAQFTHIADHIGEDELVGFGLYGSDQEVEPSDWRCLSRRDAMRFAGEIQLLAKAVGESEAPLPTVMNGSVGGRRLFKDHRERERIITDPARKIIEVESVLSKRIALLEQEVHSQANKINGLNASAKTADERALQLITAMQPVWTNPQRRLPQPETTDPLRDVGIVNQNSNGIEKGRRGSPGVATARNTGTFHSIVIALLIAAVAVLCCLVLILGRTQLSRPMTPLGTLGTRGTPFITSSDNADFAKDDSNERSSRFLQFEARVTTSKSCSAAFGLLEPSRKLSLQAWPEFFQDVRSRIESELLTVPSDVIADRAPIRVVSVRDRYGRRGADDF
jgi:hypothetical protein